MTQLLWVCNDVSRKGGEAGHVHPRGGPGRTQNSTVDPPRPYANRWRWPIRRMFSTSAEMRTSRLADWSVESAVNEHGYEM